MINDPEQFNQIARSLARHFECVYYVDIETGHYRVFTGGTAPDGVDYPDAGDDFFADAVKNAQTFVHPDDLAKMRQHYTKDEILAGLADSDNYTVIFRALVDGRITRMRHVDILCEDKKHMLCCLENIEAEIRRNEARDRDLQYAKRLARLDELTGVRNSNAYREYIAELEASIRAGGGDKFGIVMCDLNDLKQINDTRGHSYGDEAIQATSRLICDVYEHSPVFRVGGDEFVVILTGRDYEHRDELLKKVKAESKANMHSRTGPVVACGMAVYDPDTDNALEDVYERADSNMYEHKNEIKASSIIEGFANMEKIEEPIPAERKRLVDGMFGAMVTVSGGGYVFLNDMRYDFSRWALSLVDDFGLESEYMYHADKIWEKYVHPDDIDAYHDAVDAVLLGNAEVKHLCYRARKPDGTYVLLTARGFVLTGSDGKPEYFGGIIVEL